jgi:hypothetical protein
MKPTHELRLLRKGQLLNSNQQFFDSRHI